MARATYTISISDGRVDVVPQSDYEQDLIDSMDIVALDVFNELDFSDTVVNDETRRKLRSRHRQLEVRVRIPTFIGGVIDTGECKIEAYYFHSNFRVHLN